jgi:hypothetical protein
VLTAVVVAAATGAGAALASGGALTRAVIYRAFTASGAPALHVTSTVHGKCNGGSSAINRDDAWRCFAGNFVYDPCFSSSKAKGIVVCPAGPWTSSGTEIKLKSRLAGANKGRPSTSGVPWAVETTSGAKCTFATGTSTVLGLRRANYFCLKGKIWLWGAPSRKSKRWTIYAAPLTATRLTHKVKISIAWF